MVEFLSKSENSGIKIARDSSIRMTKSINYLLKFCAVLMKGGLGWGPLW